MQHALKLHDIEEDQHVIMNGMAWQDYEAFLAIRGDRSGVRMYYLDGAIEFLSPVKEHEDRKTKLARLLEFWAIETDHVLSGYGAWTLKKEVKEAAAEPDECYIVGADKDVPDLVIEVEWSRKLGLSKREIYRRLGVRELWTMRADGSLLLRVLEKGDWVEKKRSKVLPKLDVAWLMTFVDRGDQTSAVRALRDELRRR